MEKKEVGEQYILDILNKNEEYYDIIEYAIYISYNDISCHGEVVINNILNNIFKQNKNIILEEDNQFYDFVLHPIKYIIEVIDKLKFIMNNIEDHKKINIIHKEELKLLSRLCKTLELNNNDLYDMIYDIIDIFVDEYDLTDRNYKYLCNLYNLISKIKIKEIITINFCLDNSLISYMSDFIY